MFAAHALKDSANLFEGVASKILQIFAFFNFS